MRMLEFRAATTGAAVDNWQIVDAAVISFSRGALGHIAINTGSQPVAARLQTGLPPGDFTGLISGAPVTVDEAGMINVTLEPESLVVVLAGQ